MCFCRLTSGYSSIVDNVVCLLFQLLIIGDEVAGLPYFLVLLYLLTILALSSCFLCHRYRSALQLSSNHPVALLGLAESLLVAASAHIHMGAWGAAAAELDEAQQAAAAAAKGPTAAAAAAGEAEVEVGDQRGGGGDGVRRNGREVRGGGHLLTAWKLLGDVLLHQAQLPPAAVAAAAGEGEVAATAPAEEEQQQQQQQRHQVTLGLLKAARKAYVKALHLNPAGAGELWGDIALTCHREAEVRKLLGQEPVTRYVTQVTGSDTAVGEGQQLEKLAERVVHGGLRLCPSSAWLWGVLGWVSKDPGVKEYGLVRSLQLNPQDARAWVLLGRFYSGMGARDLAAKCYESARGVEPSLVAVWEGMGATAAAAGGATATANPSSSSTISGRARAEAHELYSHAVGLGGGLESWLGYAAGALLQGFGAQGGVLACAVKASAQLPQLLAVQNNLALAHEARGNYKEAVACLEPAVARLQQPEHSATAAGGGGGEATDNVELLLFAHASSDSSTSSSSSWQRAVAGPPAAAVALQLNLARCYCLVRSYDKAVALYQQLEQQGMLGSSEPYSWICYSYARLQQGDAEGCSRGLAVALQQSGWDATARLHVVAATLQVRSRGLGEGGGQVMKAGGEFCCLFSESSVCLCEVQHSQLFALICRHLHTLLHMGWRYGLNPGHCKGE